MASLTPQSLVRLALPSPVPASFPLAHGCRADRSLPWQLAGRLLGGAQCEDQGAQALPLLWEEAVCIPWCSLSAAAVLPSWADACVHVCVPVWCILCSASILKIVLYRDAVSRESSGQREAALFPVPGVRGLERATKTAQHGPSRAQHERAFNELSENFLLFYKNAKINKLIGNKL